ncbi:HAD-IIB family hydrolase [Fructilactobacillus fructivorans]|uniref:HAD-IIB family hydrolase n=1 Tax=Fructilactobacillus fructivorans TaxID=1614 RepID=A0AAE6P0H9_9LACO|nr:HAD-IIB family hydrolase [Fructilactobacillus fructivorans]KRK58646.1 HAD superfamily hydrolase [Fructilactobacillus fructivorans]KRN40200.1 HAD superfamily hydrolase [Fructilactobacillus fructivorans]QFX92649.1 HAD-IIB family hydrolase [Fructilactobacillus fructivorans]RDV65758.1 HAD-IIB family hydrolase [Fructilactobacillus fructivorans]
MLYVFDVDGTLSFNGVEIDSEIVNAIKQLARHNEIIFASARPIRDLIPIVPTFKDKTLIGANGALVSRNGHTYSIKPISNCDIQLTKNIIKKYDLNYIIDSNWDYSAKVSALNPIFKQLDPDQLAENVAISSIKKAVKIILLDINNNLIDKISAFIKQNTSLSVIKHTDENNIDLTAQNINKFSTLRTITDSNYIVFGNDSNDQELLVNAFKSNWVDDGSNKLNRMNLQPDQIVLNSNDEVAKLIQSYTNVDNLK